MVVVVGHIDVLVPVKTVCGHKIVRFVPGEGESLGDNNKCAALVDDKRNTKKENQFFPTSEPDEPSRPFLPKFCPRNKLVYLEKFEQDRGGGRKNQKADESQTQILLGHKMEERERREEKEAQGAEKIKIFRLCF